VVGEVNNLLLMHKSNFIVQSVNCYLLTYLLGSCKGTPFCGMQRGRLAARRGRAEGGRSFTPLSNRLPCAGSVAKPQPPNDSDGYVAC